MSVSISARSRVPPLAAALSAAVLVGGLGACGGADPAPGAGPTIAPTVTPQPTPSRATPEPAARNPLTGGRVSDHPVVAVKVENTAAARPQVGLSAADIVFVQEVEGGQTRLLAVYHSRLPRRLGPVRSARTTDAQLLPLFGRPGLVYSGANASVQRRLDAASLVPLSRSTRDPRRRAPHNVFVDLERTARSKQLGRAEPIGWTFAAKPTQRGTADSSATSTVGNDRFGFAYARGRYTVTWRADRYVDGDSGAVTRADNVLVMRVQNVPDGNRDVLGSASVLSRTVGRGRVTVYRDGMRLEGTWSRAKVASPLRLTDSDGKDIALRPGQTWVTLQG